MIDEPWPIRGLALEAHKDTMISDINSDRHWDREYLLSAERGQASGRQLWGTTLLLWRF